MSIHIWLRAETKPNEKRTPLIPEGAKRLIENGFQITVERTAARIIPDRDYERVGCTLANADSWRNAPVDAFILGLKELPSDSSPLRHRHIYFAHVYKNQRGWQEVLQRFVNGGGRLLDLEYLTDAQGRRVAAFGYWAGVVGCALGIRAWRWRQMKENSESFPSLQAYGSQAELMDELRRRVGQYRQLKADLPRIIVIGAKGRSGTGAVQLAKRVGIEVTEWDIAETVGGGPFDAILEHDIFVNCVLLQKSGRLPPIPPFITRDLLVNSNHKLTVISDVSCDLSNPNNPVPIYDQTTTFDSPLLTLKDEAVSVIAIDNLPSFLPLESSEDFSRQLLPYLQQLTENGEVWQRAENLFFEKTRSLKRFAKDKIE
ncbi:MAG: saccharopine dehydrogenase [Verrucomicrobia bacterium]|nr:saccharopine dehydrogenase [Verrucomicrobiota bacterium]